MEHSDLAVLYTEAQWLLMALSMLAAVTGRFTRLMKTAVKKGGDSRSKAASWPLQHSPTAKSSSVNDVGWFFALDGATGRQLWRFRTGAYIWYTPGIDSDTVYFGSADYHIYAVDQETGRERWRFKTGNRASSSVVVEGNTVYFGSQDRRLYALDATTGESLWYFEVSRGVQNPTIDDGCLFIGADDGRLYALGLAKN